MSMKILRKLSTATIMGKKQRLNQDEAERLLYEIGGVARGVQKGEGSYGAWTAFKGDFAAKRADGEIYRSPKAFLPEPFASMLESGFQSMQTEIANAAAAAKAKGEPFIAPAPEVQFRVKVEIVADEEAATGYTYRVTPVVQMQQSDAVAKLMGFDAPALPLLPVGGATGEAEPTDDEGDEDVKPAHKGKGKGKAHGKSHK